MRCFSRASLAAALVLACAFAFGLFAAAHLASALPPGFCLRHPAHPKCATSTSTTTTSASSTTSSTTTSTTSSTTTTTTTSPPPPPPPSGFPPPGIQDGAYINNGQASSGDVTFYLNEAQASGAKLYRFGYRGGQDTTASGGAVSNDAMMQLLADRGLEPVLILGGPTAPPSSTTCQHAAARYPLLRFFEVWNEPNIHGYNGTSYAPYLKGCYQAVKAANPHAQVLIGGLSYAYQGSNTSPISFMNQLYAAGGGPYFDIANVHPYDDPADHWFTSGVSCQNGGGSLWDQTWGNATYCPSGFIRQIMDSHGDAGKLIAATEAGGPVPKYTEAKQATIVQHALRDPRPAFVVVYANDDLEVPGFGLHRSDRSRRPSFTAFQAAAG